MAEQWNQQRGFNLAVRLGHLTLRAQAVVIAQRAQSIQRMAKAHTRDILKLPGGKRKLREMEKHIDRVKQILKEDVPNGD
jgi:hypothetical protein